MVKKKKVHTKKTSKKTNAHQKARLPSHSKSILSRVVEAIAPKTERVEVHVMRKTLGKAPEEYHFVLHDGRKLKSLYDLIDELETMSEDAFKEYVGEFRNDFATWARDVFHASDLAEELSGVRNRFETQKAVMKHILRDVQNYVEHAVEKEAHHLKQEKKHFSPHGKGGRCYIV